MTSAEGIPEVRFDESQARRIFPRPVLKTAVLVPIPLTEDGSTIPTFIEPEWGGIQVFYGSFYGIVIEGKIAYGSAKEQWEHMHTQVRSEHWVKTAIPAAYRADRPCRIVTLIPSDDGSIREANFILQHGDWIVRQPGGEVQHIKAAKFAGIYFSDEEAAALGLTLMTLEEFSTWAVRQAAEVPQA